MPNRIVLAGKQQLLETIVPLIIQANELLVELRLLNESKLPPPRRSGTPKITLYFASLKEQAVNGKRGTGEISFRLMESTPKSILKREALLYAERVRSKFATPPFIWRKGKIMRSYTDWDRGVQFQVLCLNEAEGDRLIHQMLEMLRVPFEVEYLSNHSAAVPSIAYPDNPGKEIVLEEPVESLVRRPVIDVTYRYTILDCGLKQEVLHDLTGKMGPALLE